MARKTGEAIRSEMDKTRAKERAEYGGYDKWEVDSWASTLQSAAEIISDPKKMKAVSGCLAKKEKAMETLKTFAGGKAGRKKPDLDD